MSEYISWYDFYNIFFTNEKKKETKKKKKKKTTKEPLITKQHTTDSDIMVFLELSNISLQYRFSHYTFL
jgi:hypothetical protein